MTWVEDHPYKMATICSVLLTFGAFIVHFKFNKYPNPQLVIPYLPMIYGVVFAIPFIAGRFE